MDTRPVIFRASLADGTIVYIQATSLGGEEEVAFTIPSFEDVAHSIESIATSLGAAIKKAKPKKAAVEFGVEITLESGRLMTLMAKGTENANLKITLEWGEENND
jgi:hypothetical protein